MTNENLSWEDWWTESTNQYARQIFEKYPDNLTLMNMDLGREYYDDGKTIEPFVEVSIENNYNC